MKLQKQIFTILIFIFMFLSIFPTQKVQAHDVYFLRVVVNRDNWLYEGRVEFDEVGGLKGEKKHAEAVLGNFYSMKDGLSSDMATYNKEGSGANEMIFSFPYTEVKGGVEGTNNATAHDAELAYAVNNVLVPSLNQMLIKINSNNPYVNAEQLSEATNAIISASSGTKVTHNGWNIERFEGINTLRISKEGGGSVSNFIYKMEKGYQNPTLEGGRANPVYRTDSEDKNVYSGDATYITVGMLAAQGLYNLEVKSISADKLDEVKKPGKLESELSKLLISFNDGIRDMLGLHSIDELVYGQGPRMSYGYTHGVAKTSWMDAATSYHAIFQVLAWIAMGFAFIKIMYEKTLSTFSVFKQISLVNSVKNLIITGFLLGSSFLLIQGLLVLNTYIASIFATTTTFATIGGATSANASFAQAALSTVYLFIAVYLNVIYILRGITIVVLIASAPLFISSMAFSSKKGELFFKWLRELIANIFIQSVHAFVLGILLTIQIGSGGLEMIVIAFALIPMTKLFKKLVVGDAGGALEDVAGSVTSAGMGAAAGFASGIAKKGGKGGEPSAKEHSADSISKGASGPNLKGDAFENKELVADKPKTSGVSATSADTMKDSSSFSAETQALPMATPDSGIRSQTRNVMDKTKNMFSGQNGKTLAKDIGTNTLKTAGRAAGFAAKAAVAAPILVGMGAVGGAQGVNAGMNILRDGSSIIKSEGKKIMAPVAKSYENADGSTTQLRKRSELAEQGYDYLGNSGDSGATVSYNESKLGVVEAGYLNKMKEAYEKDPNSLKEKGIESVKQEYDNVKVVYNQTGREQMGFSSVSSSKESVREIIPANGNPNTSYIYDIDKFESSAPANAKKSSFGGDRSGSESA